MKVTVIVYYEGDGRTLSYLVGEVLNVTLTFAPCTVLCRSKMAAISQRSVMQYDSDVERCNITVMQYNAISLIFPPEY